MNSIAMNYLTVIEILKMESQFETFNTITREKQLKSQMTIEDYILFINILLCL